jgi:sugar/nucleoside kinase (ribokinase family)
MIDLLAVGSPIVDTLARVPEDFLTTIPGAKGGMELVDEPTMTAIISRLPLPPTEAPGGSAGNTAMGAARLGLHTAFLGKLGNDPAAVFYEEHFAKTGGHTHRFKRGTRANARCLSLITPDSQRTMRTNLGASLDLSPDEISPADFEGCRHAHFEGYLLFNRPLMMKMLGCAAEAGCTISLDLASFEVVRAARDILPELLETYVDIVFANEDEAHALTEFGTDYELMALQIAKSVDIAAVKVGKAGSHVAGGGKLHTVSPVLVDRAIDTTGAGDLWAAGFLYGWLQGRDLPTCGRYGSVLGAEVVQVIGASIPDTRWDDIRRTLGT